MSAVRIHRKLDSETLYLPELRPLIGKMVEITVQEEQKPAIMPGTAEWEAAMKAVEELEDYDFEGFQRQRECDLQRAKDHMP